MTRTTQDIRRRVPGRHVRVGVSGGPAVWRVGADADARGLYGQQRPHSAVCDVRARLKRLQRNAGHVTVSVRVARCVAHVQRCDVIITCECACMYVYVPVCLPLCPLLVRVHVCMCVRARSFYGHLHCLIRVRCWPGLPNKRQAK